MEMLNSNNFWQPNLIYLQKQTVYFEKVAGTVSYGLLCMLLRNLYYNTSDVFYVKSSDSQHDRHTTSLTGWHTTTYRCLSFLDLCK